MQDSKRIIRRRHSPELKAQILAACAEPGASVAGVALAHGINANVVHRWRQLVREGKPSVPAISSGFVPVTLASPPAT